LASQQKRLEEDIKQLTTVNSQQALDLESQQAHTTYYQQQLTGSMEQVSLLQQEVQQLQEEIKAYRASEEQLQGDLKEAKSHISHLEEVQNKLSQDNEQWSQRCQSYEEQLSSTNRDIATIQTSLYEKEKEADILRDCLQQLNAISEEDNAIDGSDDEDSRKQRVEELRRQKFQELTDVGKAVSELKSAQEECSGLRSLLKTERITQQNLQERLDKLQSEYDAQREMYTTTETQFTQTNAKLQALSEYLKEREETLQTKLGKEEAAKALIANQEQTASERAAAAEEETAQHKRQINELRQQMAEIEKTLLQQLSINEKRAQESLAQLRTCEQQLRESNQEVTILKRRLADAESHLAVTQRAPPVSLPPPLRRMSPTPSHYNFNRPTSEEPQLIPPVPRRAFPLGSKGDRQPPSRGPTYPPRPNSMGPPSEFIHPRGEPMGPTPPEPMDLQQPDLTMPDGLPASQLTFRRGGPSLPKRNVPVTFSMPMPGGPPSQRERPSTPPPAQQGEFPRSGGPSYRPRSVSPSEFMPLYNDERQPGPPPSGMPFYSFPPPGVRPPKPPITGPRTSSPASKMTGVPDGPVPLYGPYPRLPMPRGGMLPPRPGMPPARQPQQHPLGPQSQQ
jgi:hypothetical protein